MGPLNSTPDYLFAGQAGQTASDGVTLPNTLDGDSAFMFDAKRDGSFHAAITPGTSTVIVPGATTPSVPAMGQPNRALTIGHHRGRRHQLQQEPRHGAGLHLQRELLNVTLDPPPTPVCHLQRQRHRPLPSCPGAQTLNPIKIGEKGNSTSTACRQGCR